MMLHLSYRGWGIGLDLPAALNEVEETIRRLTDGIEAEGESIEISGVAGPFRSLCEYIRHADLGNAEDVQKLNTIATLVSGMSEEEQSLLSGALELEGSSGPDEAIRIAECLEQYRIFPRINSDLELGRFLADTAFSAGEIALHEAVRPYPDYAKIGAEQRDTLGGVYTPHGLVMRREAVPVQEEASGEMLLTLTSAARSRSLFLPASEKELEQAKTDLEIEDFSQAVITSAEYTVPYLEQLIPADGITVDDANEMAQRLRRIRTDGETMKYCAALEAEQPYSFSEALEAAMNIDGCELVTDNEWEYGRESLRRIGAGDEVLDSISGYTDFERLGRDSMAADGVRQTEFGMIRRLSEPFPSQEQAGPAMI